MKPLHTIWYCIIQTTISQLQNGTMSLEYKDSRHDSVDLTLTGTLGVCE